MPSAFGILSSIAVGGSTNTILHTLAVAIEAGCPFNLAHLNEIAARVPHICKVAPAGTHHMEDIDRAGGISAILKTLSKTAGTLDLTCMTASGKTLGENIAGAEVRDPEVIRPLDRPYSEKAAWPSSSAPLPPTARSSRPAASTPK